LHEINKDVENLRFNRHQFGAALELAPVGIEPKILEIDQQNRPSSIGLRGQSAASQAIIKLFSRGNQAFRKVFEPRFRHPHGIQSIPRLTGAERRNP